MASILDKLSRITSSGSFIPEIDGLRFIAIVPVVLMHFLTHFFRLNDLDQGVLYAQYPFHLLQYGQNGVFVFFAISGFILSLPFAKYLLGEGRKPKISAYFIRRVTRLEPPYIVVMVLLLCGHIILKSKPIGELLAHFWASIFYVHNLVYGEWSFINPVTWSLEVEIQFYILAPVLFYLYFRIKNSWLRKTIMVAFIWGCIEVVPLIKPDLNALHLDKSILVFLNYFLLGVMFTDIYLEQKKNFHRRSYWWDVIVVVCLAIVFVYFQEIPFGRKFLTFGMLGIFVGVFKGKLAHWFFTRKFVTVTGGMCYTIYLIHYPFLVFFLDIFFPHIQTNNFIADLFISGILSLTLLWFVSALFFRFVERPCMDKEWPKQLKIFIISKFSKRISP